VSNSVGSDLPKEARGAGSATVSVFPASAGHVRLTAKIITRSKRECNTLDIKKASRNRRGTVVETEQLTERIELDPLQFVIRPHPPFRFDLALRYLRTSPATIVEAIGPTSFTRAIRLAGQPAVVEVHQSSAVDEAPELTVTLSLAEPTPELVLAAEALVRRVFGTDDDVLPLRDVGRADPILGKLVERWLGLRPVVIPDLFETIAWAIIGQQISVQFAAKCKRALIERYGDRVLHAGGQALLLFPAPERLLEARAEDLAALQFSRQKIRYLLGLAEDVAAGRLNLDELSQMSPAAALARLEGIVGIGRWTAEYVLMRGIGHRDVIPAADGGLRRIIGMEYGFGRSASEAEVRELAERWVGWRSYAAFYWWFALQQSSSRAQLDGE
jgi:DNA-3-methyladenine glycosylase II